MGMMDGGTNFRDNCKTCNKDEHGGTMRRYVHDRNVKLCLDCFEKLDVVKRQEYVVASQLRRNKLF